MDIDKIVSLGVLGPGTKEQVQKRFTFLADMEMLAGTPEPWKIIDALIDEIHFLGAELDEALDENEELTIERSHLEVQIANA